MHKLRGFTLIEIMLVLVLLSLSAVAVITTLPSSSDDRLEEHAQRFSQRLQLLNEDAMLNGKDLGVWFDEDKGQYRFVTLTSEGWEKMAENRYYSESDLEAEFAISLQLGSDEWGDDDRLFEPGSLFDEEMFADEEKKKQSPPPQVMVLSSGEITPFQVAFYPNVGDEFRDGWRIKAADNGLISILKPGERDEDE
ncbi:type II secretion system minor pseudopilin GspH [Vibrio penaeicida]|uniref:type II secretion system minor pseudopilin GspH n=1 Tax=Vibrio penaeicida TaxID=104609 RepID=UPI000CE9FA8A|nr:type II secretion system minor pseudopilin GspH [Vibrio penaeicida]